MSDDMSQTTANPPRKYVNRVGAAGFALSLLGLLGMAVCGAGWLLGWEWSGRLKMWGPLGFGALCPLGLLISAVGVFRLPKQLATLGVVLGMLGSLAVSGLGAFAVAREMGLLENPEKAAQRQAAQTGDALDRAVTRLEARGRQSGALPNELEGNALIGDLIDGYGHKLMYVPGGGGFVVRSAGPDEEYGNEDDVVRDKLPY